jgi:non-specific serine/threonine protein kinase
LPNGARLGDCDVILVIRQDSCGIVYEAVERSTHRKVAIKEYLPATLADRVGDGRVVVRSLRHQPAFREGKQAFLSEGRILAAVDEPALIKVLNVWEQHETAYVTMPLREGRTLKDALRDSERPSEAWLKKMLSPLLNALATLHARNCFPCDATPENIVLLADESPLLFDFGLTRRVIADATDDVTVVLKPGFAPIEQCIKDPSFPEGPWTDVYTLASVIYLAITGKPPTSPTTRMVADTMAPLRELTRDYSERFLDGVDRGLAVRAEHRPQTIAEFRTALGIAAAMPEAMSSLQASAEAGAETANKEMAQPLEHGSEAPARERPRSRVPGDGTSIAPPLLQVLPHSTPRPPAQPATTDRARATPWALIASLVVLVALVATGILVWMNSESPTPPPVSASEKTSPTQPVPGSPGTPPAEPAPSAAPAAEVPTSAAPRVEARPEAPNMTSPATGAGLSGVGASGAAPGNPGAPGAAPRPPPTTGKVQFFIKPWGEILVDGKSRGASPPVKELAIPEGRHRIEIRNSTFPGYVSDIVVKAGSNVAITHTFGAP